MIHNSFIKRFENWEGTRINRFIWVLRVSKFKDLSKFDRWVLMTLRRSLIKRVYQKVYEASVNGVNRPLCVLFKEELQYQVRNRRHLSFSEVLFYTQIRIYDVDVEHIAKLFNIQRWKPNGNSFYSQYFKEPQSRRSAAEVLYKESLTWKWF